MLLQSLRNFTHAGFEPPVRLYNRKPVRYVIELTRTGIPVGWFERYNPETKQAEILEVPDKGRSGTKPTPLLFADNGEATLGLARSDNSTRADKRRQHYLELVRLCAEETQLPEVRAVLIFLCNDPQATLVKQLSIDLSAIDSQANITFSVDSELLVKLDAVQSFWANHNDPAHKNARILDCIVCGIKGPVLRRWELKIKGIPGAPGTGVALVSADDKNLESYGLENSYIAPICSTCSERCTKTLNFLLEREDSHFDFGNLKFAFWSRGRDVSTLMEQLHNPETKKSWRQGRQRNSAPVTAGMAKSVVEAPYHSQGVPNIDNDRFYAIALTANPGRAIVRDWIDTTLIDVGHNVEQWFRRHRIITREKRGVEEFGIKELARATVREKTKDRKARTPAIEVTYELLRSAILGERLPNGLLYQVIRLCYSERAVTGARAALIKLALLSQPMSFVDILDKEGRMEKLDPNLNIDQDPRTTAAYHCGRAFAVLERIQVLDMGRLTTLERLFGAALSKPGLTFPSIVGAAQRVHLPRIQNRGVAQALRTELDRTLGKIPISTGIPDVLKLQEQGWFILGYHHQRLHNEAIRSENIARIQRENTGQQAELFPDSDDAEIK